MFAFENELKKKQ